MINEFVKTSDGVQIFLLIGISHQLNSTPAIATRTPLVSSLAHFSAFVWSVRRRE